ncbi:MAG: DUF177 domain-containing protein [Prevotella sp.]|nr:DUF177 domain-containing protein [Prevotella sp.]MCF0208086.1 DUF177 domain-containing protein [Bacteroidaceae bacterium]
MQPECVYVRTIVNIIAAMQIYDLSQFLLDFQTIKESEETFSFKLNDEYFKAIEATEVHGGEIETTVKVSRKNGCFEVTFKSEGTITVDCSRCLDPISLPVSTEDKLYVKLGDDYLDEGDDIVFIPEDKQKFDVAWHIYEFIALTIPVQHTHPDGECNEEMMKMLYGSDNDSGNNVEEIEEENIDPRWAKLGSLLKK